MQNAVIGNPNNKAIIASIVPKKTLSLFISVLLDTNKTHFFGGSFGQCFTLLASSLTCRFGLKP